MGNSLRLDWAEPRRDNGKGGGRKRKQELSEKTEGCVTCFVGRLADTVDDDKLEELFKEAGTIESIRYMERDGEFKGVAFVRNNNFLQFQNVVLLLNFSSVTFFPITSSKHTEIPDLCGKIRLKKNVLQKGLCQF